MKKKMKLDQISVKSFTTKLEKRDQQTAKGGDTPIVSEWYECISHFFMTCDCSRIAKNTDCCVL